jgi:phosphotransferase system  glucose/maltose/N-acetylglucosamine-specific IIC component
LQSFFSTQFVEFGNSGGLAINIKKEVWLLFAVAVFLAALTALCVYVVVMRKRRQASVDHDKIA